MRRMGDPDYVYQPWSKARRKAASQRATKRIYGSISAAEKTRARKLAALLKRRTRLNIELRGIEAAITWAIKRIIKNATEGD